jgi:hypothetical protein
MRKLNLFIVFVFVALLLVECRSLSPKPTEQDTIAIYQTVITQIYQSDDTFGGTLEKPILYLVRTTNDATGDPYLQRSSSVVLSEMVQQDITAALSNLPTTIIWVDSFDQVSLDSAGAVDDKGVIITLGNINYENNDKALLAASIYVASLAAGGKTYVVEKKDGIWVITGTTGGEWIS